MPFDKAFFDSLGERVKEYLRHFSWCKSITVTVRNAGVDYHVWGILRTDDRTVTFAYIDLNKSVEMPKDIDSDYPWVLPALTVAYELVEFVEFNPAKPSEQIGFGQKT